MNSKNINDPNAGQVVVATPTGDIDLRHVPDIHSRLLSLCESKPDRFIIIMSEVTYIDSSGVGALVEINRRIKGYGGQMFLVSPNPRVMNVFEITRLDRFFSIVSSEEEALAL